jgi:hypothetical protein
VKLWEVEKLIKRFEDDHADLSVEELGLLHNYHSQIAKMIHIILSKRYGEPEMDREEDALND